MQFFCILTSSDGAASLKAASAYEGTSSACDDSRTRLFMLAYTMSEGVSMTCN